MTNLLTSFADSPTEAAVVLGKVPDPTRFGIAEIDNGNIVRVVEKPQDPPSNLAIAGVYLFRASIFDAINASNRRAGTSWRSPTPSRC